jgi:hypothetical protein
MDRRARSQDAAAPRDEGVDAVRLDATVAPRVGGSATGGLEQKQGGAAGSASPPGPICRRGRKPERHVQHCGCLVVAATEIPAICNEAENLARRVVDCCIDTAPSDHLPPEEAAALRVELVQLAATLQAQITGIIDLRLAQITGGVASRTSH